MKRYAIGMALVIFAGAGAQAAEYYILNTSTLNDVRKVGGQNIPEIANFSTCITPSTCSGTLNPLNPADWPLLDKDQTTYAYTDPSDPSHPVGIELNNINVYGTMSVVTGSVTGAIVRQCDNTPGSGFQGFCSHIDPLSYSTYQSATVQNNLVSGDMSVLNVDPLSGVVVTSVLSNPLAWTYNAVTNQLNHQSGGGTAATTASIATCVPVTGTGISGQCRQLAAAVDASGELGQTTIGSSIWNWNGMAANYIVRDSTTLPWHAATGTSTTGGLQISGAGGQPGVVWDLSGFVDGVGGVITARVVADVLTGNSATGMSGLYTFNVTLIPIPAAVWLFGSALGVLGWMRRKAIN